jgi:hypothetical protein
VKVAVLIAVRQRPADLRQARRDPAQGPPNSNTKLAQTNPAGTTGNRQESENALAVVGS